jgi:hypothetical protein
MTRQLDRLPIHGEVLPPLKPLEEEAQECLQIIENVRSLSGRINRLNNRTRQLNQKIEDRCLLLGAKLLSMRKRVEAGEGGLSWWEWFDRFFQDVSRKTAERWLRIAATEDPPTAALEYRKRDADYKRDHRKALDRTFVSDPSDNDDNSDGASEHSPPDAGAHQQFPPASTIPPHCRNPGNGSGGRRYHNRPHHPGLSTATPTPARPLR